MQLFGIGGKIAPLAMRLGMLFPHLFFQHYTPGYM